MFMLVDLLGGIFSDLSLAFKTRFDTIAAITYSLVIVGVYPFIILRIPLTLSSLPTAIGWNSNTSGNNT